MLTTTELLEQILSELPFKDLLLAQRVSKTFQTTIAGSITLQKGLFLKPSDQVQPVYQVCIEGEVAPEADIFAREIGNNLPTSTTKVQLKDALTSRDVTTNPNGQLSTILNPILSSLFRHVATENDHIYLAVLHGREATNKVSALCGKMYLSQPPTTHAAIMKISNMFGTDAGYKVPINVLYKIPKYEAVENAKGVTVQDLMDRLVSSDSSWTEYLCFVGTGDQNEDQLSVAEARFSVF